MHSNINWTQIDIYYLQHISPEPNYVSSYIEFIINQLPKPFIIVGDFNAHNTIWGSNNIDQRGKILEQIIINENIIFLNNSSPTHLNIANGTFSNIDISLSTPSMVQILELEVFNETYSSDHFPIKLNFI